MKNEKFKKEKLDNILILYNIKLIDDNYLNNRYKHNWECLKCGNKFKTSLSIIQQGFKCKLCYHTEFRKPENFNEKLNELNIYLIDKNYINEKYKHTWKCLKCENIFVNTWNNIKRRKYICEKCSKKSENKKLLFISNNLNLALEKFNLKLLDNEFINSHFRHNWQCLSCNTEFKQTYNKIKQGYKCHVCFPRYEKMKKKFEKQLYEQLKYLNIKLLDNEYINCDHSHKWKCLNCGTEFINIWDRIKQKKFIGCSKCFSRNKSKSEKELIDFIKLNINIIENDREILNGLELDIYIPSKNIAIEFDGLYYHSEIFKNKNYHLNKTLECESKNIKLIHIFEDEWLFKQNIVKSRLKQILNLNNDLPKIYARKCEIKEIDSKIKNEFLEKYHIQGSDFSIIKLGAFYNDELVSLMTFSHGSISRGSKLEKDVWELSRFCSNYNYHIIGVASKLLSYFKKNYNWKEIYSYADRRWSSGNLYYKLGFELDHITKPNYWYIKGTNRIHRYNLRKKINESKKLTEKELRMNDGYYRIYDCGLYKFSEVNNE